MKAHSRRYFKVEGTAKVAIPLEVGYVGLLNRVLKLTPQQQEKLSKIK